MISMLIAYYLMSFCGYQNQEQSDMLAANLAERMVQDSWQDRLVESVLL
jgi:hypothetical protein